MTAALDLQIRLPDPDTGQPERVKWSPLQAKAIRFRAPPRRIRQGARPRPQVNIVGILGEYGGGKTLAGAARFLACCLANPFVEGFHNTRDLPLSGMVAPTFTDLENGPLREFFRVCPDEIVYKVRTNGKSPFVQLTNGHKILLYSAHGAINGPNLCQIWADEIHMSPYCMTLWKNIAGRVRDERATWLNAQASGLAQHGHVSDIFRDPDNEHGNCFVVLLFPEQNKHLGVGYTDIIRAASAGIIRDPDGWMTKQGLMFPRFSEDRNIRPVQHVDLESRRCIPTSLSVDLGSKAAVLFVQDYGPIACDWGRLGKRKETGTLVVDQMLPQDRDAKEIARIISDYARWNILAGKSVITMGPDTEADQLRAFQKEFPGVDVVICRSGFYYEEKNGWRALRRVVCDGHENARLFVHPALVGQHERGVVEAFRCYREDKLRDKKFEHIADCVRYYVQKRHPLPDVQEEVAQLSLHDDAALEADQWWIH